MDQNGFSVPNFRSEFSQFQATFFHAGFYLCLTQHEDWETLS